MDLLYNVGRHSLIGMVTYVYFFTQQTTSFKCQAKAVSRVIIDLSFHIDYFLTYFYCDFPKLNIVIPSLNILLFFPKAWSCERRRK